MNRSSVGRKLSLCLPRSCSLHHITRLPCCEIVLNAHTQVRRAEHWRHLDLCCSGGFQCHHLCRIDRWWVASLCPSLVPKQPQPHSRYSSWAAHKARVTGIQVDKERELIVSCGRDKLVNLHSLEVRYLFVLSRCALFYQRAYSADQQPPLVVRGAVVGHCHGLRPLSSEHFCRRLRRQSPCAEACERHTEDPAHCCVGGALGASFPLNSAPPPSRLTRPSRCAGGRGRFGMSSGYGTSECSSPDPTTRP